MRGGRLDWLYLPPDHGRALQNLEPAVMLYHKAVLRQGTQGIFDALQGGTQQLAELLKLNTILPNVRKDTQ
jgi:hypothetical protein